MTDKELRKLRRDDLLQILINQQRQIDELNAELQRREEALANRDLAVQESGTLAEAAMKLNDVFGAAQKAADEYLAQMRKRADDLVADAQKKADEAQRTADSVVKGARGEADRILNKARSEAETLVREAKSTVEPPKQTEVAPNEGADDGKRRRGLLWRNRQG